MFSCYPYLGMPISYISFVVMDQLKVLVLMGQMRVQKLNMCLHKISHLQSLIKQLWSYLQYNHASFFFKAHTSMKIMTEILIRDDI